MEAVLAPRLRAQRRRRRAEVTCRMRKNVKLRSRKVGLSLVF